MCLKLGLKSRAVLHLLLPQESHSNVTVEITLIGLQKGFVPAVSQIYGLAENSSDRPLFFGAAVKWVA